MTNPARTLLPRALATLLALALFTLGAPLVAPQTADAAESELTSQNVTALTDQLTTTAATSTGAYAAKLKSGHTYVVYSALRKSAALDVKGGGMKDQANVQIRTFTRAAGQQWIVKVDSNGYTTFKSFNSSKYLDVAGADTRKGTNVQQYTGNGTDAQKWVVTKNANGTFRIASALTPKRSLSVRGASSSNGTNVQIAATSKAKAQQWRFVDVTKERKSINKQAQKNSGSIKAGTYVLFSQVGSNKVLDIAGSSKKSGANALLNMNNGTASQRFTISYTKKGFALIKNKSGRYLGVTGARANNQANVKQYKKNTSPAQRWIIKKNADGTYCIQSALWEGYCLDVCGALSEDGANIWLYEDNGSNAQQWTFESVKSASKTAVKSKLSLRGTTKSSFDGLSLNGAKAAGIDVSVWNGDIDWNKVAASGIRFAIIRCGYGSDYSSQDDTTFFQNVKGARAAGLDIGVYLYSHATEPYGAESAQSEADHTLRLLRAAGLTPSKLKYGVYYDVEDAGQADCDLATVCDTYCSTIRNAGYSVGVYSSLSWWDTKLTNPVFNTWNRWVAQWPYKTGNRTCDYSGSYKIWQCMSDGAVPGIIGRVDMNLAY